MFEPFIAIWAWLVEHFNVPLHYLPPIGLAELLDIFIVSIVLYLVIRWIRRTRAWTLFKGIVIILMMTAIANVFNLVTVLWIVQNAFTMGLTVMVILFQPELRKALEQIGRGRYLQFTKTNETPKKWSLSTVNELIAAVRFLAGDKIGALIVLEQEVSLEEQENTGIPIDALVSRQLIGNLFEKNTPLHDGAVIIRNNRLVAAACILPLSTEEMSHSLGTRHRAAVGISEASDAVVIVVSEETGSVSVAMGGRLHRNLYENQLREILAQGDIAEYQRFKLFKRGRKNGV